MPAPIILQDQSGLAQGISGAGSALAQALQQRQMQQQQQQGLSAFSNAIQQAGNDPNAIMSAYQQALGSNVNPQALGMLQSVYGQAKQQNAFQTGLDAALSSGGFNSDQGRAAFFEEYTKAGGDPMTGIQMMQKDKKGQTVFDKKMDEFKADSVINYIQGGGSEAALNENLDYLQNNLKNVGRLSGTMGGEFLWNSGEFVEYRNRGNLALDSVIKVFNKAGVLPQKKLEWIRETFAISPWDTQDQIQGKINALRGLAKDASSFNAQMGELIDKHGENIPTEDFIKLQQGLDSKLDAIYKPKQESSGAKERYVDRLSNKGYKKGTRAVDEETGETLIFNGTRWVKQRK